MPVVYSLCPERSQPSALRVAIVAGRPPRAGEPSSGSTRNELTSAPRVTALRHTASRNPGDQRDPGRASCRWISQVIVRTSAVDGSPLATAARIRRASASVAPPPLAADGTTAAMSPASCSAARFSNGNAPALSSAPAPLANRATSAARVSSEARWAGPRAALPGNGARRTGVDDSETMDMVTAVPAGARV